MSPFMCLMDLNRSPDRTECSCLFLVEFNYKKETTHFSHFSLSGLATLVLTFRVLCGQDPAYFSDH